MGVLTRVLIILAWVVLGTRAASAGPNDFAIVIGNQSYRQGMPEVTFAKNDAKAFAKAAVDVFGVPPNNIVRADDASLGDFFRIFGAPGGTGQIDNLLHHPDAKLYVFYSGHGMPVIRSDGPRPYLMPIDASPAAASATGYALDDIAAAISRVMRAKAPSGRAILIVDACFSGTSDGGTLSPDTSAGAIPVVLAPVADLLILAAAGDREVAHWDRERRRGLFTDALLSGLYGDADQTTRGGNGDKRISLGELDAYLKQRMNARLRELNPGRIVLQTPVLRGAAETELARFDGVMPVFDAEARSAEESQCGYLAEFGDMVAIDAFLRRCVHCPCRAALEARRAKQAEVPRACQDEKPIWEQVQKSGDLKQVQWMATTARCDIIRAAAEAFIATTREKIEAEQSAREATARKAAEEKKARDEAAERVRRAEEERRLAEQRRRDEELRRQRDQDAERERRLVDERRKLETDERRRVDEMKKLTAPDAVQRISQFIELEYLQDREHFADRVDFYDMGIVGRDFIASERRKYAARWPTRQYELIPGTLTTSRRSQNEYTVTFAYAFTVANGSNRKSGRGTAQVGLRDTGAGFQVISVKEIVHR